GINPDALVSSGVLDTKPKYMFTNVGKDVSGYNFTFRSVASSPVLPLTANSAGQSIGYSEVIEMRSDGAYTVYKYTNHDNGFSDIEPVNSYNRSTTGSFPFTSLHFTRGKLTERGDYDTEGKIRRKKSYHYQNNNYLTAPHARSVYTNTYYSVNSGGR